jgi:hypothetical protein
MLSRLRLAGLEPDDRGPGLQRGRAGRDPGGYAAMPQAVIAEDTARAARAASVRNVP